MMFDYDEKTNSAPINFGEMVEIEWKLQRINHHCFSKPTLPLLRQIIEEDPRIKKYYPYIKPKFVETRNISQVDNGADYWNHLQQEENLFYEIIKSSTEKEKDTSHIMDSPYIESSEIDGIFESINCFLDETLSTNNNNLTSDLESCRKKLKNFLNSRQNVMKIDNPFLENTGSPQNINENEFLSMTENISKEAIVENPIRVENPFLSNATSTIDRNSNYINPVKNPLLSSNEDVENQLPIIEHMKVFNQDNNKKLERIRSDHDRVKSLLANVNFPQKIENSGGPSSFEENLRRTKNSKQSLKKQDTSRLGQTLPFAKTSSQIRETSFERELRGLKDILRAAKTSGSSDRSQSIYVEFKSKSPRKWHRSSRSVDRKRSRSKTPQYVYKHHVTKRIRSPSNSPVIHRSRDRFSRPRNCRKSIASKSRSRSRSIDRKRSRSKTLQYVHKNRVSKRIRSRSNSPVIHRSRDRRARSNSRGRLSSPWNYRKPITSKSHSRSRSVDRKSSRSKTPQYVYKHHVTKRMRSRSNSPVKHRPRDRRTRSTSRGRLSSPWNCRKPITSKSHSRSRSVDRKRSRSKTPQYVYKHHVTKRIRSRSNSPVIHRSRDRFSRPQSCRKSISSKSRSRSRSVDRKRSRSKTPQYVHKNRVTFRDRLLPRPGLCRKSRSRSKSRSTERDIFRNKSPPYTELQNQWRSTKSDITKVSLKSRSRSRSKTPYSEMKNRWKSFQEKYDDKKSVTKLNSGSHTRKKLASKEKFDNKSPSGVDNKYSKTLSPSPNEQQPLISLEATTTTSQMTFMPTSQMPLQLPPTPQMALVSASQMPLQPPSTPQTALMPTPQMPHQPPPTSKMALLPTPQMPHQPPPTSKMALLPTPQMTSMPPITSLPLMASMVFQPLIEISSIPQQTPMPFFDVSNNFENIEAVSLTSPQWTRLSKFKKNKKKPHNDIHCKICNVFVNTEVQYYIHAKSKKHKKKEELMNAGGKLPQAIVNQSIVPQVQLTCDVCQKYNFQTVDSYNNHMMSIKHIKNFTETLNQISEIKFSNQEIQQFENTAIEMRYMYVSGRGGTIPGGGPSLGLPTGWGGVVRPPPTGVGVGAVTATVTAPADLLATISMFEQHVKAEPMGFYASTALNRDTSTNNHNGVNSTDNKEQQQQLIASNVVCPSIVPSTTKSSGGSNRSGHSRSKPQACKVCGKVLSSASSYYVHMKLHSGNKPFTCTCCEAAFCRKPYLEVHMRTHTGERPFQCELCLKRFTQKSSLNTHKRVHTGERPYACDICEKRFAVKSYVTAHRWSHVADKPLTCDRCSLTFTSKSQFAIHIRTHSAAQSYECNICGRTFVRDSYLIRHHNRVHRENPNNTSQVAATQTQTQRHQAQQTTTNDTNNTNNNRTTNSIALSTFNHNASAISNAVLAAAAAAAATGGTTTTTATALQQLHNLHIHKHQQSLRYVTTSTQISPTIQDIKSPSSPTTTISAGNGKSERVS